MPKPTSTCQTCIKFNFLFEAPKKSKNQTFKAFAFLYLSLQMVILVDKLNKLLHKLENHHQHNHHHDNGQQQPEALSASLQAFRSHVSSCIIQLSLAWKPGSEILSLAWIQKCFQLLPAINKAFAKLAVDIDHHMSKWEAKSTEEYLRYSLSMLDLFNSISSSLSHLRQARLSLSHALSLVESSPSSAAERLKAIEFKSCKKDFRESDEDMEEEQEKERCCSDKDWIICQALMEVKKIGFWVCCIVLAGLCGDAKPFTELRKSAGALPNSSLISLDSSISSIVTEKGIELEELKELKDAASCLAAAVAIDESDKEVEEMQRKLEVFEKLLDSLGQDVDRLFSEVLAGRSGLLDGLRQQKQ